MKWFRKRKPLPPGRRAENLAARRLRLRGCRILERNTWCGRFEIDIIARKKDTIIFVEVRSAASGDPVPPEDSVDFTKRNHIRSAARQWIQAHREYEGCFFRFDVMAVILPVKGRPKITHYVDAFGVEE